MLKHLSITLFLVAFFFAHCNAQESQQDQIKQTFANYKNAILNDRGKEAVELIDKRTIEFYETIIKYTRFADSLEVTNLPFMEKFTVLLLRHKASKEELNKMDGKATFLYAIDNGMVSKNSVVGIEIEKINLSDNFAKGQVSAEGKLSPINFHFYKESDIWKLNLTSILPTVRIAFDKMIKDSGEDENTLILKLLSVLNGREPNEKIWRSLN